MKLAGFKTQFFAQVDNVLDKQYYMMPRVTGDRNDDNNYEHRRYGAYCKSWSRIPSWYYS